MFLGVGETPPLLQDLCSTGKKRLTVRRGIAPGNTFSLWSAVKIAKDINMAGLPGVMYLNNTKIPNTILALKFADFFENKVENIYLRGGNLGRSIQC